MTRYLAAARAAGWEPAALSAVNDKTDKTDKTSPPVLRLPDWPEPIGPPEPWLIIELAEERAAMMGAPAGVMPEAALASVGALLGLSAQAVRAVHAVAKEKGMPHGNP